MKWCKDPKIEHYLRSLGIKFETATVSISDIDRLLSAEKQVRLGKKINDEWVLQYAAAGETGSVFPMVVLNKLKKGYFIWSGNHRIGAADLQGDTTVDAYIVDVNDPRISDIIPRTINALEAQGVMNKDEKLVHAKYLVDQHSMDPKDAARLMSIKYEWLNVYLRTQQVAEKINQTGVSSTGFSKTVLNKLATIANNTNVLRETTRLLNREKVVGREAEQVIDDVKRGDTEMQQLKEIAKWEEMLKARKEKSKVKLTYEQKVRSTFLSYLQRLEKLTRGLNTREKLQLVDEADYKLAKDLYKNFIETVGKILK